MGKNSEKKIILFFSKNFHLFIELSSYDAKINQNDGIFHFQPIFLITIHKSENGIISLWSNKC